MVSQRELTKAEQRVLKLLRQFDRLVDARRATASIEVTPLAYSIIKEKSIMKPSVVTFDGNRNSHILVLSIEQFNKYIKYCCKKVGFKVLIDGSVETIDGLILSEEYLQ